MLAAAMFDLLQDFQTHRCFGRIEESWATHRLAVETEPQIFPSLMNFHLGMFVHLDE